MADSMPTEIFRIKNTFSKKAFTELQATKNYKNNWRKGMNEQQIRKTWEKDLEKFKQIRKKYLIYP